jgi:hypothetical protein
MQEETEKRDHLIYELNSDRFRLEWQRTNDLDRKASSIIGFVGIIVSLQAGLGGFLLKEVPRTYEFYVPLCTLFLSDIILLMCSIICGLGASNIRFFRAVPETRHLIEEYGKKDRSTIIILRTYSQEFSKAVIINEAKNNNKAKFIKVGLVFLILGIFFVFLFVSVLLNGDRSNRGGSKVPRMWDYVFSVKLDEEEPLEKWNSITPFIEEFKRHKLPLSRNAIMFPLVQDYHWRINDGDKEYEIRREKKLKIYSEKVSAGAYSRSFKKNMSTHIGSMDASEFIPMVGRLGLHESITMNMEVGLDRFRSRPSHIGMARVLHPLKNKKTSAYGGDIYRIVCLLNAEAAGR